MTKEQKQQIILGVLFVAVLGVVAYQFGLFGGGSTPAPKPAQKAATAPPAANAPAGAAAAPAATAAADAGGPTRLAEVNVNIDELIQGVVEVTFDYETMRIDRDPLAALVGGPLKLELPTDGPITTGGVLEITRKKITGIVYDDYSPMAVVDDEVVGVGHVYPNGIRVHSIDRDKVTFQLGDSLIPVEMKEQ